jgi:Predicted hydrolase of the metallo-beta-lactamase superfamily
MQAWLFLKKTCWALTLSYRNISYLKDNKDCIRGLVLTHGHEDHIGALPYVLKEINTTVLSGTN